MEKGSLRTQNKYFHLTWYVLTLFPAAKHVRAQHITEALQQFSGDFHRKSYLLYHFFAFFISFAPYKASLNKQ